ncbi:MAG: helix-turn-helix transcriptional regulator [Gemmataceae bacterium]|nr:helix-turn-helix transcriptional regulator [Gemmataceae bacterium]
MEKSIHTREYAILLELLREAREEAGLTQVELAERLGQSQSFVSKAEVGERRLDLIQLRTICLALGATLLDFVAKLEERLSRPERKGRPG